MKLDIQKFAVTTSTTFNEPTLTDAMITGNYSTLQITIYINPNNNVTWFQSRTLYCWVGDVEQSQNVSLSKGGSITATFTFENIPHNADGTKTISWEWYLNSGTSVIGTLNPTGTRALQTIPRASQPTLSSSSIDMGNSVTITTNRVSNNFTHTISYSFGNINETIATNVGNSTTWTPPISLANQIPNSTSGTCTITCITYNGETVIGTKTVNLTLNVPSSIVPSVSIGTLTEANTTMQSLNWGVFVQNKSQLNIPITATGIYGSSISSIITTINGLNFTGSSVTTSTLVTSGTNTISTTVTDSRGRTATTTKTYNVVAYANPLITTAQAQRCLNDGTISEDGTYLLYSFVGSISPVSNNNSKNFRLGYKRTIDNNYTYVTLSTNYSINISDEISSFTISPDYAYDVIFEAIDSFMTNTINRIIDTGFDLLNFNANGKAMAIGKVSEAGVNEELLEIDLPMQVTQPFSSDSPITTSDTITGNDYVGKWNNYINDLGTNNTTSNDVLVLNGTSIQHANILESGVSNSIYYEKRSDGVAICYGSVALTSNDSRSQGGLTYYSASTTVNLPVTFTNTNYMYGFSNVIVANMNRFCQSYVTIEGTNQIQVLYTNTTYNEKRTINYLIIGKWK